MYSAFMQFEEVLVTGGTGAAGAYVCRALIDRGVLPRLLVRPASEGKIPPEIRDRCRVTLGDLAVREFAELGAQGTSAVVHLAGAWKESARDRISFEESIVHATRNVLHAAKEWGIERVILASVAGARAGDPVPFLDAKGRAEQMVRDSGCEWTIFRPEPFYDLRDGTLLASVDRLKEFSAAVVDALYRADAIRRVFEGAVASSPVGTR